MKPILIALLLATAAVAQAPEVPEAPEAPQCIEDQCIPCDPNDPAGCDPGVQPPGVPGISPPQVEPPIAPPDLPTFRLPNGSTTPGAAAAEYEFTVWTDGQYIRDMPVPGIDLIDLRVYEADFPDTGGGLVMRYEFTHYPGLYDAYEIQTIVAPDAGNASAIVLSSEDGISWTSNAYLLSATMTQDDAFIPAGSTPASIGLDAPVQHVVHVHASYATLGIMPGGNATDWRTSAAGFAGDDRVANDRAPGGYMVAAAEAPELDADGKISDASLAETADAPPAYFLAGAGRHLEASGAWEDGQAVIDVKNPYSSASQQVFVLAPTSAQAAGSDSMWLSPGQSASFAFDAALGQEAKTLQWAVRAYPTGGWAALEVTLPAAPPAPSNPDPSNPTSSGGPSGRIVIERTDPVFDPPQIKMDTAPAQPADTTGEKKEEESPIGLWLTVGVLVAFALRRQQ